MALSPSRRRVRAALAGPVVLVGMALIAGCGQSGVASQVRSPSVTTKAPTARPPSSKPPRNRPSRRPPPPRVPGPGQDSGTRPATATQTRGIVRIQVRRAGAAQGSISTGMVVSSGGLVVTNHHAVTGASSIEVTVISSGRAYAARIVGSTAKNDLALLRLDAAAGLSTVATDTAPVRVGQKVTAVGDAGGLVGRLTASPGRVRSVGRTFVAPPANGLASETLHGVVELTSDVQEGDSGGPTYDDRGRVVGMTTANLHVHGELEGIAIPIGRVLAFVRDRR